MDIETSGHPGTYEQGLKIWKTEDIKGAMFIAIIVERHPQFRN
jgi:hypothetical protein